MQDVDTLLLAMKELCFAYLVDMRGGQVTIPVKELTYANMSIRMALNTVEQTVTLTLRTEDASEEDKRYNEKVGGGK